MPKKKSNYVRNGKTEEFTKLRIKHCAAILVLLKDGPMTSTSIARRLSIIPSTAYSYLVHLRKVQRKVHTKPNRDEKNQLLWGLGEDKDLPARGENMEKFFSERREFVPARQIGYKRDPLIAALFGPAA